jgi:nucleoside-diphosphate-sugar epimerase
MNECTADNPVLLETGMAGFIGYDVAKRLLERADHVLGLDKLNDLTLYLIPLNQSRSEE